MARFAVFNHKGKVRGYETFRGAKNAFGMAAYKMIGGLKATDDDIIAQHRECDRHMEWDVRRSGAVHFQRGDQQVTLKSMIA